MTRVALASISVGLCLLFSASGFAAVPASINVQGRLTDNAGKPIGGEDMAFAFRIFSAELNGVEMWPKEDGGEQHTLVPNANGLWETAIGTVYPIYPEVFYERGEVDDTTRWLEITIKGVALPRIRFISVPYAIKVGTVQGALGGSIYGSVQLHGQLFVGNHTGMRGRIKVYDGAVVTITAEGETGDLTILGKATIGSGHTNTAIKGFVAGDSSTVTGDYATASGGLGNGAEGRVSAVGGGERNFATDNATVVAGGSYNYATANSAAVGGGLANHAEGIASTISGGEQSYATEYGAAVGGGAFNYATGRYSVVGGGLRNKAGDKYSVVAGGELDTASGVYSAIGGGKRNYALDTGSVIGGGAYNRVLKSYGTISGGNANKVDGRLGTIGGGDGNTTMGFWSTVAGGHNNIAASNAATVGGGRDNTASYNNATVAGGSGNLAAFPGSTVGGGSDNQATGSYATIPGGEWNKANGETSFAAGHRAQAVHDGAVVIAANARNFSSDSIRSSGSQQMVLRADGHFYLTDQRGDAVIPAGDFLNTSTGAHLTTGGAWTNSSDADKKENFVPIDRAELLEQLAQLRILEWNYQAEEDQVRHIGPTAQDFRRIFALGTDDKSISTIDPAGIALVAIQELHQRNERLAAKSQQLETQLNELQRLVIALLENGE